MKPEKFIELVRGVAGQMSRYLRESPEELYSAGMLRLVCDASKYSARKGRERPFVVRRARAAMVDHVRTWNHYRKVKATNPKTIPIDIELHSKMLFGGQVEAVEGREVIDAMENLDRRQAEVMRLYYWEGMSMREVAKCMGICESMVSKIHAESLKLMRVNLGVAALSTR